MPLIIKDYAQNLDDKSSEKPNPIPDSFGYNLNTIAKARQWLINPHNWHRSNLFILKWNGLLPTIDERYAEQLIDNPNDYDLPWCVVFEQRRRHSRSDNGEVLDDKEVIQNE